MLTEFQLFGSVCLQRYAKKCYCEGLSEEYVDFYCRSGAVFKIRALLKTKPPTVVSGQLLCWVGVGQGFDVLSIHEAHRLPGWSLTASCHFSLAAVGLSWSESTRPAM